MTQRKPVWLTEVPLNPTTVQLIIGALFFFSGCAALIYQVIWQRMLFMAFGTDLISITVIVSVFMFGLGIGGLLGGYAADKWTRHLLFIYVCIELSIATFGFSSPSLIDWLGSVLFSSKEWIVALVSFVILAFPTILMGATFPILVTHINLTNKNIGRSVGSLYFFNTFGGATGAYLAGFVLLYSLDLAQVINRAALLNLAVGLAAMLIFKGKKE